jgi:hypothetical protein
MSPPMERYVKVEPDVAKKNARPRVSAAIAIAILTLMPIAKAAPADAMKIRLALNGRVITATLIDSETKGFHFAVAAHTHDERSVRSKEVWSFAGIALGRGPTDAERTKSVT